jgi:micrococcal nuclease
VRTASIIVAVLAVGITGCHARTNTANTAGSGDATVVRVIDGDTVVVHIDGHDEHVRLIGIDTPNRD